MGAHLHADDAEDQQEERGDDDNGAQHRQGPSHRSRKYAVDAPYTPRPVIFSVASTPKMMEHTSAATSNAHSSGVRGGHEGERTGR